MEEIFNERKLEVADELIAEEFTEHNPPPGFEAPPGREMMKQMVGMFAGAFPDMRVTVNHLIAEGDMVVGMMTMSSGTQKTEFMGIPATGKSFEISEIHIVRIVNGQAVEHWGLADDMSMMQQLGVMPSQ